MQNLENKSASGKPSRNIGPAVSASSDRRAVVSTKRSMGTSKRVPLYVQVIPAGIISDTTELEELLISILMAAEDAEDAE